MNEDAAILNRGTFAIDHDEEISAAIESYGAGGTFVNRGVFQKIAGTGTTVIGSPFENFGSIKELSGHLEFLNLLKLSSSAATPNHACAGDPVDCGTGDFTESQTDLAVGGRGVGLDLTRNYSAQAAASGASGHLRPRMDQLLRSRPRRRRRRCEGDAHRRLGGHRPLHEVRILLRCPRLEPRQL